MANQKENILDDNFYEESIEEDLSKGQSNSWFGIFLAKWSFIIGTLIFVLALIFKHNFGIIFLGGSFIMIAFVVNLIFFLFLCIKSGTVEEKESDIKTAGIMALNIPIALVYAKIILAYL